jgi:ABC-type sugar transport system ATPase subunit
MASIALHEVTRRFGRGVAAVRNLQLEIAHGELLVLVGPSGSGKSTVLRLIAGLDAPTTGRILIDGQDVTGVPPQRRDLAMVFQSYALYPHKTVRENLAFGLQMRRMEAAQIEERVHDVARSLGIDGLLDRRPAALSGGQRQRVALGRAIVRDPKAFLLDEPLSNLDPLLRIDTRAELALLHRRLAATMVYVTHDQEEAMTLGSRIAVMRDGLLEQVAAPMDLYDRPANTFVAGFIGSPAMNIWPCTIHRDGGAVTVRAVGFEWHNLPAVPVELERVQIGVRPYDIDVAPVEASDITGRVELLEPLGPTTLAYVRTDRTPDARARLVVLAATRIAVGDRVGLTLRRDRVHWFDENGRRIPADRRDR